MKLENYFKIKLEVQNVFNINNVDIKFNQIIMKSEEELNPIIIKNRKFVFTIDKSVSNVVFIYIQNDGNQIEERIDYLLDEEWEIQNLDITILEQNMKLPFTILNFEQISSFDFEDNNGLVSDFLKKQYINDTICILGPKPNNLFGFNMNDIKYAELKRKILEKVEPLIQSGKNIILTNGYIGGETLGFEVGLQLKQTYREVQNILAVPFIDLDAKWIDKTKKEYRNMIQKADGFIEIDKVKNYKYGTPEVYTKEKLIKKNDFDVDFASIFIVINDKTDTLKGIKKQIQYANKILIEIDAFEDSLFQL